MTVRRPPRPAFTLVRCAPYEPLLVARKLHWRSSTHREHGQESSNDTSTTKFPAASLPISPLGEGGVLRRRHQPMNGQKTVAALLCTTKSSPSSIRNGGETCMQHSLRTSTTASTSYMSFRSSSSSTCLDSWDPEERFATLLHCAKSP